ncbi:response regulator [Pleurocapsa sp. FMAR1]|uniref:response regulator n=1 Tax=Pleurocapsa sp. FMAR1 TaxID=3040204 RepID=UPI0029C63049|nr:response regulator [Pleurocapsa sp. FMAR1]
MCFYKGRDILVVDDYEDNLLLIQFIFEALGCKVRTACNGKHGLIKIEQACPDLIILDLMMPDISGIEFMKCLKDSGWSDIPVLLLTANVSVDRQAAKDANSICYKPIDINDLTKEAGTLLAYQNLPR